MREHARTLAKANAGACGFDHEHMHARWIRRGRKSLGELGIGGRALRRWAGDSKLGGWGLQLGDGNALGTFGTPNLLWGAEVVHGRSAGDEPVTASCQTSFLPPSRAPESQ